MTDKYDELRRLAEDETDAAFIAAASPDVVLGLLDEIAGLSLAAKVAEDHAHKWAAERDEAREAVKRLAGVLADYANMGPYRITGEALTPTQLRELIGQVAQRSEDSLADPVVEGIMDGG